jgi:hypothetical protein
MALTQQVEVSWSGLRPFVSYPKTCAGHPAILNLHSFYITRHAPFDSSHSAVPFFLHRLFASVRYPWLPSAVNPTLPPLANNLFRL